MTLNFDWVESYACTAKMLKSSTNSGIVLVDAKATRNSDRFETFRTEVMNLVMLLQNHLDCDVKLATKIKVFSSQAVGTRLTLYAFNMLPDGRFFATELASAPVPFSFGRWRYFMMR